MFSYKFVVDKARKNVLRLRITSNRRKAEFSLGLYMTEEELAETLGERCRDEFVARRRYLLMWKSRLEGLKLDLIEKGQADADVTVIKRMAEEALLGKVEDVPAEAAREERRDLFLSFFERVAEGKANRSYRESLLHTMSRMKLFDERLEERTFADINVKWLNDFDGFMVNHGSSQNTRAIHFRNIRTVINRAIDEELTECYPFRRFKIRTEATVKRSLTVEELRELWTFATEPADVYYVDIFKLIFMLVGINIVDLHGLTEISPAGRIEYRRAKTHKLYSIKVEPEALEIINRYKGSGHLLDFADRWSDHRYFRRQMNEILQGLGVEKNKGGRLAGGAPKRSVKGPKPKGKWPGLTSYWARHTWATIAYSLDIPKDVISQALGHSSGNAVTEIYINRDERKIDEANRRVLDWVLYGKR